MDECVEAFQEIKLGHKWQYVIFKLSDDLKKIVVDEKGLLGRYEVNEKGITYPSDIFAF